MGLTLLFWWMAEPLEMELSDSVRFPLKAMLLSNRQPNGFD